MSIIRSRLLLTTAIAGAAVLALPSSGQAAITETKTTTYTYDFPDSTPKTSVKISTVENCYRDNGGGGDGGGGDYGGNTGSYGDSDGDGTTDAGGYQSGVSPGSDDGWGDGGTTTSSPGQSSFGGDSGGGGGGGSVICTYFFQKGELTPEIYFADMEYTRRNISIATIRGYHFWAIPYARYIRNHPDSFLEKLIRPVVIHRSRELAYQMGVLDKPDYLGKIFRLVLESISYAVGVHVSEQDWRALYTLEEQKSYQATFLLYQSYQLYEKNKQLYAFQNLVRRAVSENISPAYAV